MKAILWTKYGPPNVLELKEIEKPIPKDNEVLVRVHAATVTAGDCELRSFKIHPLFWLPVRLYMGIIKPRKKVLGQELAGEVESVGKAVKLFKKGNPIFAATGMRMGAYAEYICLSHKRAMAMKPTNITFEEAATIPTGGINALHFLRKANIQVGQKVLINGAGGSIGTYGVQLAKLFGAIVTCVDHKDKLNMLRSIGADHVIDYTEEDFTRNGETYDVIFDIVGNASLSRSLRSLNKKGVFLMGNPKLSYMIQAPWISLMSSKKVIFEFANENAEDLNLLKTYIEAGKIKSIIDCHYPLEQISEAHNYVEKGQKKGNLVITLYDNKI